MSPNETIIEGTLKSDGTLVLDQMSDLPPGRVTVRMQPLAKMPERDPFFKMLKDIWETRSNAGLTPRSVDEIESQRRQFRDDSEREIVDAGRIQKESRLFMVDHREQAGGN
jgi:hypothetical protein